MLAAILALGLWPLIVIAAVSIAIIATLDHEEEGWATAAAIVGVALVLWIKRTNPWPWITAHTAAILWGAAVYFVAGVAWAFVKWCFYLLRKRDELEEGLRVATAGLSSAEAVKGKRAEILRHFHPPKAAGSKARIIGWMAYWPWSAAWTLLNDPVRRLWRAIYARLATTFEKISARVFARFGAEIADADRVAEAWREAERVRTGLAR